jgi:hypothetical protein
VSECKNKREIALEWTALITHIKVTEIELNFKKVSNLAGNASDLWLITINCYNFPSRSSAEQISVVLICYIW